MHNQVQALPLDLNRKVINTISVSGTYTTTIITTLKSTRAILPPKVVFSTYSEIHLPFTGVHTYLLRIS